MTTLSTADETRVTISATPEEAGARAAEVAGDAIVEAIGSKGSARVIFASAPSQDAMLGQLSNDRRIDWSQVEGLHMDEYVGIDPADPRSFGRWLADRLPVSLFASFDRIDPLADSGTEAQRYEAKVRSRPVDVTCLGFGVNGHIAFNEPGSDLNDSRWARVVDLTPASRRQQVDDGQFADEADVPRQAVTLAVPALLSAGTVVATVLGSRKAAAVAAALTGPITPDCPASAIRRHAAYTVHLDAAAAASLE